MSLTVTDYNTDSQELKRTPSQSAKYVG